SAVALIAGLLLRSTSAKEAINALAYGYRIQSAILLLLAVPVAFSGSSISIGWAGLALALAAVGAQLKDRPTRYTAVIAWLLSLLNLFLWTNNHVHDAASRAIWLTLFGQPLAAWTIIGFALALAGHVIAF